MLWFSIATWQILSQKFHFVVVGFTVTLQPIRSFTLAGSCFIQFVIFMDLQLRGLCSGEWSCFIRGNWRHFQCLSFMDCSCCLIEDFGTISYYLISLIRDNIAIANSDWVNCCFDSVSMLLVVGFKIDWSWRG